MLPDLTSKNMHAQRHAHEAHPVYIIMYFLIAFCPPPFTSCPPVFLAFLMLETVYLSNGGDLTVRVILMYE